MAAPDIPGHLPALAEGVRLVHIGPHKTGTTTLQAAFHARRDDAAAQGVHYTGRNRQPMAAVLAVTDRPTGSGHVPPLSKWVGLVHEVDEAAEPRVVVSSEFFADALAETVPRIVADLGGDRVHVVVTLRPLAKILASQWQQYVQSGMRAAMERWLTIIFSDEPERITPTFWRRHRHDALIRRWADVVGAENVTVVVVDDREPDQVLRVFESLVALEPGLLTADRELRNRSLTLPEVEVVRAFNKQFWKADLSRDLHTKAMRFGAAVDMKHREPAQDEARVVAPQWALDRAGEIAAEMVANIRESGVRVVGDLDVLTTVPAGWSETAPRATITPEIAAGAAMGVVRALEAQREIDLAAQQRKLAAEAAELVTIAGKQAAAAARRKAEDPETAVCDIPARDLARVLIRRGRSRIGRTLRLSH